MAAQTAEELAALVQSLEAQLEIEAQTEAALRDQIRSLNMAFTSLHSATEVDEERMTNALLKRIAELEREKTELLARGTSVAHLEETLMQLKRDKIAIEASASQESESVVNKLTKEKSKLEMDQRTLTSQLQHCPAHEELVRSLSDEVTRLKHILADNEKARKQVSSLP